MLPLSPCYVVKNKRVPEAPGPFCRPGNSQSLGQDIASGVDGCEPEGSGRHEFQRR